MHKVFAKVAVCQVNQWAMSFSTNRDNIIESIKIAKEKGAAYRLGPELETTAYTCEDHCHEPDTERHSWDVIAEIMRDENLTKDILCEIGAPVSMNGVLYICRIYILNQKIILIRPKLHLAGGDNNRELRWFKDWTVDDGFGVVTFELPQIIKDIAGQ
jgi:NAD+ synthase (glutamine-hydrolysing)